MPDPRILKVLKMTAAEWGQLPISGNERDTLKKKALDILAGKEPEISDSSAALIAREEAILRAKSEDVLSRSGFEAAMVQQAKFFGEAVETLREEMKSLRERLSVCESKFPAPAETTTTT